MFELFKKRSPGKLIKRFRVSDMHCSACSMEIDENIEKVDGVKSSRTSYAKGLIEVEVERFVSDEMIFQAVKKAGYSAVAA